MNGGPPKSLNPRQLRARERELRLSAAVKKKMGIKARRKRSAVSLKDDDRRFEIALWLLLTLAGGMGKYEAAYLVMLLIGPLDISPLTSIDDVLLVFSGSRQQYGTNLEHYAERIQAKSAEINLRALQSEETTGKPSIELGWLLHSMKSLAVVISREFEPAATSLCMEELAALGWREKALEVKSRWEAAKRSNFPPHTEKLSRAALALLARLKSHKLIS